MNILKISTFGLLMLTGIAATPASAASYIWDFKNLDSTVVANGHLTTNTPANTSGEVTAITGQVLGSAISHLVTNPVAPATATSQDGLFYYDNNLVYPDAPHITNPGLLLDVVSNIEYNIFSDSATDYELYSAVNGAWGPDMHGTFEISAVPEPAAWALLLAGFGTLGMALRMGRRQQAVTTA